MFIFKKYWDALFTQHKNISQPNIIPRSQHNISRKAISKNALKVLHHFNKNGFNAYLVGGSIRDILLDKIPKDFDIATDAHPEQIKQLFRNCLLIGRRFRIAHVRFSNEVVEVSTFRAHIKGHNQQRLLSPEGMLLRDNSYGSINEDAWRRDFSINALYYDVRNFTLIDYCNGLQDIQHKTIRIIGNPEQRYQEDPVRLLRAIRLAAKFEDFQFETDTKAALIKQSSLLTQVDGSRLFEEILKLFRGGQALLTYRLLKKYGLLQFLFPTLIDYIEDPHYTRWVETACRNTDARILARKTVSPAFLFAVFLWPAVIAETQKLKYSKLNQKMVYQKAIQYIIAKQHQYTTFTKMLSRILQEIWMLQPVLIKRYPSAVQRVVFHARFRAAYDFLLLRIEYQEIPEDIGKWWTHFLTLDIQQQETILQSLQSNTNQ